MRADRWLQTQERSETAFATPKFKVGAAMLGAVYKRAALQLGIDPQLWDDKGDAQAALTSLHDESWIKHWFLTWVHKEKGEHDCDCNNLRGRGDPEYPCGI